MTLLDATSLEVFQELVDAASLYIREPNEDTKEELRTLARVSQRAIDRLKPEQPRRERATKAASPAGL